MIAANPGINWVNYIEYEIENETVIIKKDFRLHKYRDNNHPKTENFYDYVTTNARKEWIKSRGGLIKLTKEERRQVFEMEPGKTTLVGILINNQLFKVEKR